MLNTDLLPNQSRRKKKVVIIIPTHRPYLTADDETSLAHHKKYLKKYDTYFIIPKRISGKEFVSRRFKVKKVDNRFFGTIHRYSELILTKKFYESFKQYDYMLIYHLDVLVFSDQLEKWVNSGYDYIGPPWFRSTIGFLSHKKDSPSSGGNGGFSLKNIHKAIKILDIVNKSASRSTQNLILRKLWFLEALLTNRLHKIWLNAPADNYPFNEDGFWSLEAQKYMDFKVAPFKVALQFGFETKPRSCFKLNNNKLPFGVHAWKKYDQEFWKPYLLKKIKISL